MKVIQNVFNSSQLRLYKSASLALGVPEAQVPLTGKEVLNPIR